MRYLKVMVTIVVLISFYNVYCLAYMAHKMFSVSEHYHEEATYIEH